MIRSFGDRATEDVYHGRSTKDARSLPSDILSVAVRKLDMLNAAAALGDLRSPPGNRLEPLQGEWRGHFSIRINQQWRIVFRWEGSDSHDVRIVDYH